MFWVHKRNVSDVSVARPKHILDGNKFSFLKEGLPSLKTACAPCMLGTPPNLVIFMLH